MTAANIQLHISLSNP